MPGFIVYVVEHGASINLYNLFPEFITVTILEWMYFKVTHSVAIFLLVRDKKEVTLGVDLKVIYTTFTISKIYGCPKI